MNLPHCRDQKSGVRGQQEQKNAILTHGTCPHCFAKRCRRVRVFSAGRRREPQDDLPNGLHRKMLKRIIIDRQGVTNVVYSKWRCL